MSTPSLHPPEHIPARAPGASTFGQHEMSDPGSSAAWSIISYILSGILFWGVLGWLLDQWLFDPSDTTTVFLPIGVLVGTAAGGYLGYMRYLQATTAPPARPTTSPE